MTIKEWLVAAFKIERRRSNTAKYAAYAGHLRAFPLDEIDVELDPSVLEHVGALLKGPPDHYSTGFARPHRGARGDAPQTPIIVALANRVSDLKAAGARDNAPPAG